MGRETRSGLPEGQAGDLVGITEQAFKRLMRDLAGTYANRVKIDRAMLDAYWAQWQHCTPDQLARALAAHAETEVGGHLFPTAHEIVKIIRRQQREALAQARNEEQRRELDRSRQLMDRSSDGAVKLLLKALRGRLDRTLTRNDYLATLEAIHQQHPEFELDESIRRLREDYGNRSEDEPSIEGTAEEVIPRGGHIP